MVAFKSENIVVRIGGNEQWQVATTTFNDHVGFVVDEGPKIRYGADVHHTCAPPSVYESARSWVDQLAEIGWPSRDTHQWEIRQDDRAERPAIFAVGWEGEATLALVSPLPDRVRWETSPIPAPLDVLRWVIECRGGSWD